MNGRAAEQSSRRVKPPAEPQPPDGAEEQWDTVDEASFESFPCSDAPAWFVPKRPDPQVESAMPGWNATDGMNQRPTDDS